MTEPLTILCLSSYFKGEPFLRRAAERGAKVYLLTLAPLLGEPWPRESLTDVFAMPPESKVEDVIKAISYVSRTIKFDRVVPLDDFDVETAAAIREHLRLPGMNASTARLFRDKLAMRTRAKELGIAVPDFVGMFNDAEVDAFLERVPPPWMNKPRTQASAVGISKLESKEAVWKLADAQGDERAFHLLERYLPGDVYHVDAIVSRGEIVFAEAHRCGKPPFDVAHGGGIFTSRTVTRGSVDEASLLKMNERLVKSFGITDGGTHVEFIKGREDGKIYFLECGARVGGAHICEMIEASTGVNPWSAWADTVIDGDAYKAPKLRKDYGGLLMTLARDAKPDLSGFSDPEVKYRAPEANHAGLVVASPNEARVISLVESYAERLQRDFATSLPASMTASH